MSRKIVLWIAPAILVLASLACAVGQVSAPAPAAPAAPTAAPAAAEPTSAPAAAEPRVVEKVVTQVVEVEKEVGVAAEPTAAPAPAEAPAAAEAPSPAATAVPRPADMFFKEYGVNPFLETNEDHLSTFALDVDTGSYTIARRYVTEGNLPPQEAVRVEEFVNYFRQDYPLPPKGKAFAVHVDGAPFPFAETPNNRILRIGIQGYDVPPEERLPAVLTFVIDVSGSMGDNGKLEMVKDALATLVNQLRPDDSVGIVVYTDDARIIMPTTTHDREQVLQAIEQLQPENSTNAEAGLRLGYQLAVAAFKPDASNRVILCSDGVANVGNITQTSIWQNIEEYAAKGINLTSIGVGMGEYNDVLLEQLADKGKGTYHYVDTLEEAQRLFEQNLTGTLQAIAEDAKVQVGFNPDAVVRYRLIGFENRAIADTEFRVETGKAGQIGAGHHVTALYEVELKPDAPGRIATVYLRWKDPETKEVIEIKQPLESQDLAPTFTSASPRLQWSTIVAEYAEVLRQSPFAMTSTLAAVLEEAQRTSRLLPDDPDVAEFVDLVQRAVQVKRGD
jgi:Ca-activated chloride channel family protein